MAQLVHLKDLLTQVAGFLDNRNILFLAISFNMFSS